MLALKPADAPALRSQALAAMHEAAKAIPLAADRAGLRAQLTT